MNFVFKVIELVTLFIGLPLLYYFDILPGHKSLPLLVVFVLVLIYLITSKKFNRKELGFNNFMGWKGLITRMAIGTLIIFIATIAFIPEALFYLPKNNPMLWALIMIFYPLWSAFTQELIYRPFFFFRYQSVFENKNVLAIVNGLLFGFLHFIFGNWIAVVGATIIGTIWAFSYQRHKSLLAVAIEHAFIGNMLYTIGLGQFFYVPDF
jgi:membrane protease YdiL (CAAX protease family)